LAPQSSQGCTLTSKLSYLNTIYSTWMSPFIKEEIDVVIKHMPANKALSPDGFNGLFLKKCWHIIKEDIYNLCQDFYNGIVDIQPLNNALITLVLKINTSTSGNDFRPISLINCVTKILGSKLQQVIIPLVHLNQYGFIKSKSIQDRLAWAFEFIHQCHCFKREIVILKLDFTKAFDTIEHTTIFQVVQHLGFNNKWIGWVQQILSSASTSVLLNRVPGKNINCQRGVKQGDPLSPLLFVLAADLLQCVINRAHQ
jgi:hypothetical protein